MSALARYWGAARDEAGDSRIYCRRIDSRDRCVSWLAAV